MSRSPVLILSMAVIALNPGEAVAGLAANALVVAAVVVSRLGVWRGGAS